MSSINNDNEFAKKYVGNRYFTKDGKKEFEIIEYNTFSDVTVRFLESGYIKKTNMGNINAGLPNPFSNSPIAFEDPNKAMVGTIFPTNNSGYIKILNADDFRNVQYQFLDEFGYIGFTTLQNIKKKQVKNPYKRDNRGGYLGASIYNNDPYKFLIPIWRNMINRATNSRPNYNKNRVNKNFYYDSGICDDWMCYANFAEWYFNKLSNLNTKYTYYINKDVLYIAYRGITNNSKYYSPETVELIPEEINKILIHYCDNFNLPQDTIKILDNLVEKYYNDNALSDKAYGAIKIFYCNYKDITVPSIGLRVKKSDIHKNDYAYLN